MPSFMKNYLFQHSALTATVYLGPLPYLTMCTLYRIEALDVRANPFFSIFKFSAFRAWYTKNCFNYLRQNGSWVFFSKTVLISYSTIVLYSRDINGWWVWSTKKSTIAHLQESFTATLGINKPKCVFRVI